MTKKAKTWTCAVAALACVAAVLCFALRNDAPYEVEYITAKVEKATIGNSVTATGTIEPVTEVEVGTQVSGMISHIYVDYNSVVKKGQVIAELDKTNLISQLNSAKSQLASAQANLKYQQTNYRRLRTLHDKGLVSDDDFETARLAWQQAEESVKERQEAVSTAQTNLGYATITSPIDGTVLTKDVEEGQTVASSYSTPTLFTIAQDLRDMRVIADVDEADIGQVAEGQRVTFTVDAFPDDTFSGTVTQVRQEATTTNNVVTYEVVISAPNSDLKLKPGLTANVTIYTAEINGVLCVPSKALKYTPTKETVGNKKIQDVQGKNKVWTIEGDKIVAHSVSIGATDGSNTQILKGISSGTKVITGLNVISEEKPEEPETESSPFAPGPPDKDKKKK